MRASVTQVGKALRGATREWGSARDISKSRNLLPYPGVRLKERAGMTQIGTQGQDRREEPRARATNGGER